MGEDVNASDVLVFRLFQIPIPKEVDYGEVVAMEPSVQDIVVDVVVDLMGQLELLYPNRDHGYWGGY